MHFANAIKTRDDKHRVPAVICFTSGEYRSAADRSSNECAILVHRAVHRSRSLSTSLSTSTSADLIANPTTKKQHAGRYPAARQRQAKVALETWASGH